MWLDSPPVMVLAADIAITADKGLLLYNSTYLLYPDEWKLIDTAGAFLINAAMRQLCTPEDSQSLAIDYAAEDMKLRFLEQNFVVGICNVQA